MLQAYPLTRNLPIPDFFIPFAHLIWVPNYLWEHWSGLSEPVKEAWNMNVWILPVEFVLAISFFYFTHKMTDFPLLVKIGFVLYFGFMFGAGPIFGFKGSPSMNSYEQQIADNANPEWNDQHVFLHIWFLVVLWGTALTVPYQKLSLIRAGVDPSSLKSDAPKFFESLAASSFIQHNTLSLDISLQDVLKEALYGKSLLPQFSSISRTSKYLIVQGVIYASMGIIMFLFPNAIFAKIMFIPEPFATKELPYLRLAGLILFIVGWYCAMQARTNNLYWIILTILPRICFVVPCMLALYCMYGVPIQLAGTLILLDPFLAYTTYLSMKADVKTNYTPIS